MAVLVERADVWFLAVWSHGNRAYLATAKRSPHLCERSAYVLCRARTLVKSSSAKSHSSFVIATLIDVRPVEMHEVGPTVPELCP